MPLKFTQRRILFEYLKPKNKTLFPNVVGVLIYQNSQTHKKHSQPGCKNDEGVENPIHRSKNRPYEHKKGRGN